MESFLSVTKGFCILSLFFFYEINILHPTYFFVLVILLPLISSDGEKAKGLFKFISSLRNLGVYGRVRSSDNEENDAFTIPIISYALNHDF